MNDVDRAECEDVWRQIVADLRDIYAPGVMTRHRFFIERVSAAKRKWEKAAANAKLEEAAEIVEEWDDDFPRLAAKSIRALKQE